MQDESKTSEEKTIFQDGISPEVQEALNEALMDAAAEGDAKKVRALLKKGAKINSLSCTGHTPLHWAAYFDHIDVVALLLAKGAATTIHAQGNGSKTALHFVFDRFKGIKFNYDTTKTKLIIELLVNIGKAEINAVDACKRTPLWHARFFELGDDVYQVLKDLGAYTKNNPEMLCMPELTLSEIEKMRRDEHLGISPWKYKRIDLSNLIEGLEYLGAQAYNRGIAYVPTMPTINWRRYINYYENK